MGYVSSNPVISLENLFNVQLSERQNIWSKSTTIFPFFTSEVVAEWGMGTKAKTITVADQRIGFLQKMCKSFSSFLSRTFLEFLWKMEYWRNTKLTCHQQWSYQLWYLTKFWRRGQECRLRSQILSGWRQLPAHIGSMIICVRSFKVIFPLIQQIMQPTTLLNTNVIQLDKS